MATFTKQEAIELVEDNSRCPRCRYLAARAILSGKWKMVCASTVNKADRIVWSGEPKEHR
jgi:hypothetical protein